jgi:predicted GNAT family acetyltransferase
MSEGPSSPREIVGEVVIDGPIRSIEIHRTASRFEIHIDGEVAFLTFRVSGSAMAVTHTEVPRALRGKGLGEALARAALEDARARGLTVKPYCPFVARYIESHPEYAALVDPAFPTNADHSSL